MHFPHETFAGPPIDDEALLASLPEALQTLLREQNGCVAYRGGLHIRGAVTAPDWHSLRAAWTGPEGFVAFYPEVEDNDIPFAEEACGDQFLLREGRVVRLYAETGEILNLYASLPDFIESVIHNAQAALGLDPVLAFHDKGETLKPGQLLSVLPPFCMEEAREGVSLRAVDLYGDRKSVV